MDVRGISLLVLLTSALACGAAAVQWNETMAQSTLFYAYGAYCNQSALEAWTCKWCMMQGNQNFVASAFPYDKLTNTFGYVGHNPDNRTIVVSFRGTENESLKNWITDLYFPLKEVYNASNPTMEPIEVHSGFYGAYKRLSSAVRSAVQVELSKNPSYSVLLTGHSLGAALSTLCALDLVEQKIAANVSVINFGNPRVGNDGFADYFNTRIPNAIRVVNNRDIVPALPPRVRRPLLRSLHAVTGVQLFGFMHEGTEVWEHRNRYKYVSIWIVHHYSAGDAVAGHSEWVCDGGEDPTCSDSVVSFSPKDHVNYMGYETCECKSLTCS